MSLSFAASFVSLGWLERTEPGSWGFRLGEETLRLLGDSASLWFLAYSAVFAIPAFVLIAVLRSSRFHKVLLRVSGFAPMIAVFVCFWPWRWGDVRDLFPVLLIVSVMPLYWLHLREKRILVRWIGVVALVLYFGVFGWLFTRILYVPVVLLFPALALVATILWAREVRLAALA